MKVTLAKADAVGAKADLLAVPVFAGAELLKARSLVLNRQHDRAPWLQTEELLDHLLADWKAMIPFNRWLERVP